MSTAEIAIETTIEEELRDIAKQNGGTIRPVDVLEYARDPETALHSRFTWDNGEAAERYRLWQAREVLHVYVRVSALDGSDANMRVFVSLPSDRQNGNGYRVLSRVMRNKGQRAELLDMALTELKAFRKNRRYKELTELRPVWDAIDSVLG